MNPHLTIMRSGARINPQNPRVDLIHARDIAEHLAKQPMYLGATQGFYSVAQHSTVLAAELCRAEGPIAGLYALVHHAAEAFTRSGPPHPAALNAVHGAFDLDWPMPATIKKALDHAHASVEMSELRQLCAGAAREVDEHEAAGARPLRGIIKPVGWDRAMERFIDALRVYAIASQLPISSMPAMGDILL